MDDGGRNMKKLLHFEGAGERLAPWSVFTRRVSRNLLVALVMLGGWLVLGMLIYRFTLGAMDWPTAFESAAMIAAGMGPLGGHEAGATASALAGLYALGSLFVGFIVPSLVLAPVFHRVLHRFHIEDVDEEN
jgi:hypothetical protein